MDGLAIYTYWSARYAGLHDPSPADLKRLQAKPDIAGIVTKSEFLELFMARPPQGQLVPDYLMAARPGYSMQRSIHE